MTVRIVVDSTSDLGAERAAKYDVAMVPLIVSFGDQDFRDGIDLDNKAFYEKLVKSTTLPKTSAPSVGACVDAFRAQIKAGATGVLSLTITGALSGTLNSATLAAQTVSAESGVPIRIIDSRTVSVGIGYVALLAAQRAAEGASLDDVAAYSQSLFDRSKLFFVLDTLEYLEKGGRIGRAKAVFGTILNIKPILTIKDGEVHPLESARSRGKALARIAELMQAMKPLDHVALAASDDETAAQILEVVQPVFDQPIEVFKLGAVIGTYAGPRAGGILAITAPPAASDNETAPR